MQRIIMAVVVLAAVGIVLAFERDHLSRSGEAADCAAANPVITITTLGSGQKPGINEAVSHRITGNIVGGPMPTGRELTTLESVLALEYRYSWWVRLCLMTWSFFEAL